MSPLIRVLSDEVIGKIAAGEVVERPASAIKELVENSLDAGATHVTVEIQEGGIHAFRVSDNGSGISSANLRMAFERHATSKIRTADDLFRVATMGFRGEALSSIASVSHVTCTTKEHDAPTGIRIRVDGGVKGEITEAACPDGTTMQVRDLFYNTPVRLKFLKRPGAEAAMVSDVMVNAILSRPDVSFRLIQDGKTVFRSPGDGKLESAAFCVLGRELLRPTTRTVKGNMNGLLMEGYVGVGESGRGNRSAQWFIINNRPVQAPLLSRAVEEACRERVMIGHFPMCILHITMPLESLDVNVHPNKLEVRFQNESDVTQAVVTLIREALRDESIFDRPETMELEEKPQETAASPGLVIRRVETAAGSAPSRREEIASPVSPPMTEKIPGTADEPGEMNRVPNAALQEEPVRTRPDLSEPVSLTHAEETAFPSPVFSGAETAAQPAGRGTAETSGGEAAAGEQASFLDDMPAPIRLIGEVFHTYILLEYEDQFLMIDQHAAHERLNYDAMMQACEEDHPGQELLMPMVMSVSAREMELLERYREMLERIGLVTESFGPMEISVRSIPMILGIPQTEAFVREILSDLEREPTGIPMEKRRRDILQRACKHAVKGGEVLDEAAMRNLVSQLVDRHVTPTCPHGRPIVIAISRGEIEKKFRRIQPA